LRKAAQNTQNARALLPVLIPVLNFFSLFFTFWAVACKRFSLQIKKSAQNMLVKNSKHNSVVLLEDNHKVAFALRYKSRNLRLN